MPSGEGGNHPIYFRLYTFAGDHPEAEEIFKAID